MGFFHVIKFYSRFAYLFPPEKYRNECRARIRRKHSVPAHTHKILFISYNMLDVIRRMSGEKKRFCGFKNAGWQIKRPRWRMNGQCRVMWAWSRLRIIISPATRIFSPLVNRLSQAKSERTIGHTHSTFEAFWDLLTRDLNYSTFHTQWTYNSINYGSLCSCELKRFIDWEAIF